MLSRLGAGGKTLLVDIALDDKLAKSVRNITGVDFVASARVRARDVMNATQVFATRGALEKLQEVLA
jgi:ribosomal protein L4